MKDYNNIYIKKYLNQKQIYNVEGINYDKDKIKYTDNQNIIDLIDKKKIQFLLF